MESPSRSAAAAGLPRSPVTGGTAHPTTRRLGVPSRQPIPAPRRRPSRSTAAAAVTTLPQLRRLLWALQRLRTGRPLRATDLASELEVSVRTAYRDLDFLRDVLSALRRRRRALIRYEVGFSDDNPDGSQSLDLLMTPVALGCEVAIVPVSAMIPIQPQRIPGEAADVFALTVTKTRSKQ